MMNRGEITQNKIFGTRFFERRKRARCRIWGEFGEKLVSFKQKNSHDLTSF